MFLTRYSSVVFSESGLSLTAFGPKVMVGVQSVVGLGERTPSVGLTDSVNEPSLFFRAPPPVTVVLMHVIARKKSMLLLIRLLLKSTVREEP